MTLYHGTRRSLVAHSGLCLTSSSESAAWYGGGECYRLSVDLDGLTGRSYEVSREDRDNNEYPADRAADRAALVAEGVDYVEYQDQDEQGQAHDCIRLLSPAALARVDVASAVLVDRDGEEITAD